MKWTRRDMLRTSALGLIGGAAAVKAEVRIDPGIEQDELVTGAPIIEKEDYLARIAKAQELLGQNKMDGLMIAGGTALSYFGGVSWGLSERLFAMVIPQKGNPEFVCPAFEEARAREQVDPSYNVRTWHEHESPFEKVKGIFTDKNLSAAKVGIEERVRFFESNGLAKAAPHFELVSGDTVTIGCRAVKSDKELEIMRRANRLTVKVYERVYRRFKEGMKEDETSRIAREEFGKAGVNGGAFVLHGENSAYPHGTKNRQPLREGMIVLMDGGFRLNGYASDITRTMVLGEPTQKQLHVWNTVKAAQIRALETARAELPCGEVDTAARKVITDAGYGPDYKYFTHRLGHGIGMDGHEWPYLVRGNSLKLRPGMTFSNEPGIYIYGEFGVRIEDIMYIDKDGRAKLFTEQSPSLQKPY